MTFPTNRISRIAIPALALALLFARGAEAARPTITAIATDETTGSVMGANDGNVQPGETISLRVTFTNNGAGTQNVTTTITTADPYAQIVSGYGSVTVNSVPAAGSAQTGADLLRVRIRQDAPCGRRIPVVVKVNIGSPTTDETFTIQSLLVGAAGTAQVVTQGPMHLDGLNLSAAATAWKETAPQKLAVVETASLPGTVRLRIQRIEGSREAIYDVATGTDPQVARGSDGFGVVYVRSGNIYFRKYSDNGTATTELLVDNNAANDYYPRITHDPVIGWVIVYAQGAGPYNYITRRVVDAGTSVSAITLTVLSGQTANNISLALENGLSGGSGNDEWSYFSLYFRGGGPPEQLLMKPFWWWETASANNPSNGSQTTVESNSPQIGQYPMRVVVVRNTAGDGGNHWVLYQYFTGVSTDSLTLRRISSTGGAPSSPLDLSGSGGGFGADILFGMARRGADDDLSVITAENGATSVGYFQERRITGTTPAIQSTRDLTGNLPYYKLGTPSHFWLSPDRTVTFFIGGSTDGDSLSYLTTQTGDLRTYAVPLLGNEIRLTQFGSANKVAVAAAGDRVGVFTFSFGEGGFFLRILDRNGDPAVPIVPIESATVGGGIFPPYFIDVASDGTNFLCLYRIPWANSKYRFALVSGTTGALLAGPTDLTMPTNMTGNIQTRVAWTGSRYRFLVSDDASPNYEYVTGTITAAGVEEGANRLTLGTMPNTLGSFDETPELACNGFDKCWIAYGTTLRTQTTTQTTFSSRTLSSAALVLGSDTSNLLILRADGNFERCWPDGTQRSVVAFPNDSGTDTDYQSLFFAGDGYRLFRISDKQPTMQVLGLDGSSAPGFQPYGDILLGNDTPAWDTANTLDIAPSASGEIFAAWSRDETGFGDYDVVLTRAQMPDNYIGSCSPVANSGPATSAGGPYTLYIRSGGSPYVLTDGASGTNQATFQVGGSGVSDADFGGRVVSAGWDFTGDGVIDRPVTDGNGDGTISQAESQVVLSSAELLGFGFPTNTTTCSCPVRFYATDQLGLSAYTQLSVTMVDQVPPAVELTTPNGGEAWPGGSTQDITWAAEDNVATGGFDLAYVTEKSYLPNAPLPRALTDGAYTFFYFDIPAPAYTVVDINLDIDVRWGSPQATGNIQLYNLTTGIARWLQNGSSPLSNFTEIVGNYDRTLATNQSLATFDGASSGSQWRVAIYDVAGGGVGTVYGLRLNIVTARTPIVAGLAGAARSYAWTLPTATSPATRVEITARDSAAVPNSDFDDSDGNFFITQPNADQVRTLVAWNETRMRARYPSYQVDAMEAKLLDFVSHAKIDGVLIDLSSGEAGVAGITAAYAAWDGTAWNDGLSTDNATNGTAANAVATAIRNYLYGKVSTLYPNLETMVFVGGDVLVPFFREADTTPLHPETNYPGELASFGYTVNCNATRSPTWAAVCANSYLSDGRYGASSSKPVPGSPLSWWLPDVAVGRLVESPDQISGLIDTYIAQDGVTIVDQALTTGYDFLADGGDACYTVLTDGLEPGAQTITRLSEFLSAWSDTQLKNQLFGLSGANASDLSFVSGHADHRAEGAAAAGAGGILDTVEMNTGTSAVPGAALVGLGCHTGLSVLPDGGPSDSTSTGFQLDLAELFATKRFPAFVGNTGFGWGFTDGVGLGEKLIRLVAEEVVRSGQVSLGEALRLAKQEYFLRQDRVDDYDHKVIHESTLYGIPNYEVRVTKNLPLSEGSWYGSGDRTETLLAQQKASRIPGRVWLGDPSWTELELAPGRKVKKSEASAVGESPTASLRVMDFVYQAYDAGLGQTWDDAYVKVDACRDTTTQEAEVCSGPGGTAGAGQEKMGVYLTLDGQATGEPGGAIQPAISFDTHLAGTELHGILLKGGEYVQPPELNPVDPTNCFDTDRSVALACFDPVIGTPQTKAALPEGPAPAPFVRSNYPTPFVRSNYPTPNGFVETNGNSNGAVVRWDNLNAPMGELVRRGAKGTGPSREEISTEWLYRTQEFTQYYSNSVDWTAPVFGNPTGICEPFPDWTASTAYALGEVVVPVPGNGHAYTVTVAGTTAASQPVWPTGSGATVGNGTVTFQERSLLNCYSTLTGLTLAFNVPVTDAGDGVYKVYITSTQDVDGTGAGEWTTLELTAAGGGVWTGSLPVTRTTSYLVQAVDWAGNVAVVRVSGSDIAGNGSDMGSDYSLPRQFGVVLPDADSDGMPDAYESQYPCLNGAFADGSSDPDLDYLTNTSEFGLGTGPCSADSDGGGDNDGSELNNGRSPKSATDDLDVTIAVTDNGSDWTVDWNNGLGQNAQMDGWWHVYRSGTPFFGPADKVGPNHPNATTSWIDNAASCDPICFYRVWNVALATPPPTIAAIVPNSGPAGTAVAVYGSNFVEGSIVTFDGVPATGVTVINPSHLTCNSPAGVPSGPADVRVISPNGQDGLAVGGYTYP